MERRQNHQLTILSFLQDKDAWVNDSLAIYQKKISFHHPIHLKHLKTPKFARDQKEIKRAREGELIIQTLAKLKTHVVLLDEGGRTRDSVEFAKWFGVKLESSPPLTFVIGGAYGFSKDVVANANEKISLSPLTFSHPLAEVVLLEQIYRALSILKNTPYHNGDSAE